MRLRPEAEARNSQWCGRGFRLVDPKNTARRSALLASPCSTRHGCADAVPDRITIATWHIRPVAKTHSFAVTGPTRSCGSARFAPIGPKLRRRHYFPICRISALTKEKWAGAIIGVTHRKDSAIASVNSILRIVNLHQMVAVEIYILPHTNRNKDKLMKIYKCLTRTYFIVLHCPVFLLFDMNVP